MSQPRNPQHTCGCRNNGRVGYRCIMITGRGEGDLFSPMQTAKWHMKAKAFDLPGIKLPGSLTMSSVRTEDLCLTSGSAPG